MKRSKWKGICVVKTSENTGETFFNLTVPRKTSVIPKFIGKTVKIHNGKKFKEILLTKEMLHHKLGEFFKTRADFEFKKKKKK